MASTNPFLFFVSNTENMGVVPVWKANADRLIRAFSDNESLPSRCLAANRAVMEAILSLHPESVLDMGCGEGWLVRALSAYGIEASGLDIVSEFIGYARTKGKETYFLLSYKDVLNGALSPRTFDAVVFNFSLFEEKETADLLAYVPRLLHDRGHVIIQIIHPFSLSGDGPYVSRWEYSNRSVPEADLLEPHAWYFRTVSDWVQLVLTSGFELVQLQEPLIPESQKPISLLLIGRKSA